MEFKDGLELIKDKKNGVIKCKWEEFTNMLGLKVHPDTLRKNLAVGEYSGYNIINYYEDLLEKQCITDDDKIAEKEKLNKEIKMNTQKLRDQRRELRKYETSQARYENLRDYMVTAIEELPDIEFKSYSVESKGNNSAVLMLSDWHCGAIIDNQFNFYNVETMLERAEILKNKVIHYGELHDVSNLYIEINGDMVSGLIHVSSRVQSEEDVVEQIVTVSEALSQFINDLKPHFNKITVVTTLGNHGRILSGKADTITQENFEMLIPVFLKQRVEGVTIIKSHGTDFVKYEIDDKVICVAHGQNDKVASAISDFAKVFKVVPDEVHLGHTHSYKDINDCDTIVTVNGSLMGSDDYAVSLRKVTQAHQNMIIYGEDRCIYSIKL